MLNLIRADFYKAIHGKVLKVQIMLKRNASSATAELLFHF